MEDNKNHPTQKASKADPVGDEGEGNLPVAVGSNPLVPSDLSSNSGPGRRTKRGPKENVLPIVPIKNAVLFPHNILPLAAGNIFTAENMQAIARAGGTVGVVAQRNNGTDSPTPEELYLVGTEAKVLKLIRFPDGTMGAVLQGTRRFAAQRYFSGAKPNEMLAEVRYFDESDTSEESLQYQALGRSLKQLVQKAVSLSPNIPPEAVVFIENVQDPAYLADLVVPYLTVDIASKQELLEIEDIESRLRRVHYFLTREIEILEISQKIHSEVRSEVGKQQRKYYVKEQLKLLQKELGELDGKTSSSSGDPVDLKERVEASAMPREAKDVAFKEIERMGMMQSGSPEYMVSYTYVNWLLDVPWGKETQAAIDLKAARKVLDEDHYGLEKVKKRILEFLAVYALKGSLKGPILLLVGPPGVGKTSLGRSVARALGRKFVRIALGGVRDEAEIRGHRRTYIGSMPGKFVDALKKAGSMDPVILLDEVDKIAADFRGDPSSALLEVLDSEQNHNFVDHYLNVPIDLSKVLFIATANTLQTIQGPLRDRMEILELSGYTFDEKAHIARDHLLPQVIEDHGLKERIDVEFPDAVLRELIHDYTREAGVRDLRRQLASVARNIAREWLEKNPGAAKTGATPETSAKRKVTKKTAKAFRPKKVISAKDVRASLGAAPFSDTKRPKVLPIGVATGLAYTPVGGDVLLIETARVTKGTGKLSLTGQLGDVMKESAQTALAYIAANASKLGLDETDIRVSDVHIHFPAGAVKKDGPSAGVAIFLSLVSQFSSKALRSDVAVTGEISLRGEVLAVGGIKEKLLAAHRYGIRDVLIPAENEKDLEELPKDVLKQMKVHPIASMGEALRIALPDLPFHGVKKTPFKKGKRAN